MTELAGSGSIDTLIFDMDGVVTTEEKYWACVRLTLWELITETIGLSDAFPDAVHDPAARLAVVSDELIYALKGRAVNSNWDITYIVACVYLAALCDQHVSNNAAHQSNLESVPDLYSAIRAIRSHPAAWPEVLITFLDKSRPADGHDLIRAAGVHLAAALTGIGVDSIADRLIDPDGALWWDLHARFQRWYSSESMLARHAPPLIDGTVLSPDTLHSVFSILQQQGYIMGVATGRPRDELDDALRKFDLLRYFDPARIVTLDVIRRAESALGVSGLSKPHPYSLLKAISPNASESPFIEPITWAQPRPTVAMIGDSTGDIQMARAANAHAIGVLTGVRGESAQAIRREVLIRHGAAVILPDLTALPDYLQMLTAIAR